MSEQFECTAICTCKTITFRVRYRKRDEDLIQWMETVINPALAEAHTKQSPLCMSKTYDLKLPMPVGSEGIGMRVLS